jgi:hypothetical protein
MNSQDFRSLQEAYMEVVENQQLDEISLKTKMKAYAASRDVDADYAYGSKVHDQGDRIKKSIVKKHGEKAGEDAERHAEVSNFGRGTPKAKPRIEKNRTYRTTKTGKMHGQDQAKLKKDLQYKRSSRNEEYDLYDIILSHLLDEGYAETEDAAESIMVNMSEEWRQSILDEGDNYDKNRQRAAKRAAERNAARDAGKTGNVPGVGYVTSRRERETYRDSGGVERHTSGARMPK